MQIEQVTSAIGYQIGVCGSEKWKQSPFCRTCSIRLQRVHLMATLKQLRNGRNGHEPTLEAIRYFHFWDLFRDYLINRRREKWESE